MNDRRSSPERRLLLVEFLSKDRYSQYRSELFPFVRGYLSDRGCAVRWICFGYDPDALPNNPFLIVLSEEDTAQLVGAVREFAPTHACLSEELDEPLNGVVRDVLGDARLTVRPLEEPGPFRFEETLLPWMGLPPAGGKKPPRGQETWLVDVAAPDFSCELLNDAARSLKPFVQVLGGPACLYRAPFQRNPYYDGVDLTRAGGSFGCAFCGLGKDTKYPYATPPVDLALRQVRAAHATCPPERNTGQFLMTAGVQFALIRPVLEAVLDADLPPSDFQFSCRIDELRRKVVVIDRLLPRLRAAGHSMSIANMGVENFSPAENRRMNKGIEPEDIDIAVAHMDRWERDFPETFRFWEPGGFGFVLFTPWTTLEDLRINLAAAERYRLPPESFFFAARMQLMPDRPISLLAEHERLVVRDPNESGLVGFNSGCIMSAHEFELPWRFEHPEIAPLYDFFLRMRQVKAGGCVKDVPDDEPDLVRVRELLARLSPAYRSPYQLLPVLLDVVAVDPSLASVSELIAALEEHAPLREAGAWTWAGAGGDETGGGAGGERGREAPEVAAQRERIRAEIGRLLARLQSHPRRLLRGYALDGVTAQGADKGWGEVVLRLHRGNDALVLHVLASDAVEHAFVKTERFAVFHSSATPVETDEKRSLIDLVARAIERFVDRPQ